MRNPIVETSMRVAKIDLFDNEMINIFLGGTLVDKINNVELVFRDGVLEICVNEEFIDTIQVKTYEEVYG